MVDLRGGQIAGVEALVIKAAGFRLALDAEQARLLLGMGALHVQGLVFSRPVDQRALAALLTLTPLRASPRPRRARRPRASRAFCPDPESAGGGRW